MLFIHRHTMLYRMECISKIAHIDFDSLKPADYIQINISCLLLLQH
ncbi:MAG: helix-turn-helix domain-containing protein [Lachnospiraceae bacterium]|nr:helix-turn-helix domain-containing protein [Lachnospiraceae bacterium]